jgi:hypothetical protein
MTDDLDATIGGWFRRATALQDHLPIIEPYRTAAEVEDRFHEDDEVTLAMSAAAVIWTHAGTDVPLVLLETAALWPS